MNLTVIRRMCGATCTIGELLVNGTHECYTLEDQVRPVGEPKVFGETAIPYGTYQVIVNHSNHFGRDLPLLVGVPDFEGVRIHSGNKNTDTEGCLLVGTGHTGDSVTNSRVAFDALFSKIRDAIGRGEKVWITYQFGDI